MQQFLNSTGVPLSVAVYLATDHYDFIPNTVSATALLKPVRQRVLSRRVPPEDSAVDVTNVVKSRIGTAIHDGIEKAWVGNHYKQAMTKMGYPDAVVDRVVVNPEEILRGHGYTDETLANIEMYSGELPDKPIPVFMEIRNFKEVLGKRVSGKFDFVAEGRLEDFKSTSTFSWGKEDKAEDFKLQGSIYRWLNPEIITEDHMAIQFFFTDWSQAQAKQALQSLRKATTPEEKAKYNYPQRQVEQLLIPLLSLEDTQAYVESRESEYQRLKDSPQEELPLCTKKELWQGDSVFKYYKNPKNRNRSTKNFTSSYDAHKKLSEDGHVGVVVEVPGQAKACNYCPAFSVCTQKDVLILEGRLVI